MKNYKLNLLLLIIGLLSINLVIGASPFTSTTANSGILIAYPPVEFITYNESFTAHVHIINATTGKEISNTLADCYAHLYNSTGGHIFESKFFSKDSNGVDLEYTFSAGNFTEENKFNTFYLSCNTSSYGEVVKGPYLITKTGGPANGDILILGFSILFLVIMSLSVVLIIKMLGHIVAKDYDILDLAKSWGLYFSLIGVYQLSEFYLNNTQVVKWFNLFVDIYAIPMIVVPIIALILSIFTARRWAKEEANKW